VPPRCTNSLRPRSYVIESVYQVVLSMSIPAHIRQLILHISDDEGKDDGFVRELTFAKPLYKHVV